MCMCVNMCTYIYRYTHTHTNKHIYIHCCHTSSAALTILRNYNSLIAFEPGMWGCFFLLLILYFWLSQFIRCVQKLYFLHVVGTLAAQFPAV